MSAASWANSARDRAEDGGRRDGESTSTGSLRAPRRTPSGKVALLALAGSLVLLSGCSDSDAASITRSSVLGQTGSAVPTVALNRDGHALVTWVEMGEGGGRVMMSAESEDGTFGAPVVVNDIPGDVAPHGQAPAQIATGPGSDVYVVWQNVTDVEWLDFGASDVRFARSSDGGRTWSPALTVNDNPHDLPARNTFHNIAVAPDGTIYVSWIDARVRDGFRGHLFHETGGRPTMEEEPGTEIRISRSTDGGRTFEPSTVLESNSCPCCRTSTAIGPHGAVYVSYRKIFPGQIRDIVVARSTDGGHSFGDPVRVHADDWEINGCPHAGASLSVDDDGRLHVSWFTGAESDPGAFYAFSDDGGQSFSAPEQLTPEGPVATSLAQVAADGSGGVWVTWEDLSGEDRRVAVGQLRDGQLHRIAVDDNVGTLPSIAAAGGRLAVVWQGEAGVRLVEAGTGPDDS